MIAVANQKGGVAKTTTVASLGAAWSQLDQRVLIVDLDPQACLTFSVGYDPESISCSVYQLLVGRVAAEDAVLGTEEGPDLLPATIELATAEQLLVKRKSRERLLKDSLEPLLNSYDFIVLDCPPTLGILTTLGLIASHGVLIPMQCETLSRSAARHDLRRQELHQPRTGRDWRTPDSVRQPYHAWPHRARTDR